MFSQSSLWGRIRTKTSTVYFYILFSLLFEQPLDAVEVFHRDGIRKFHVFVGKRSNISTLKGEDLNILSFSLTPSRQNILAPVSSHIIYVLHQQAYLAFAYDHSCHIPAYQKPIDPLSLSRAAFTESPKSISLILLSIPYWPKSTSILSDLYLWSSISKATVSSGVFENPIHNIPVCATPSSCVVASPLRTY